MDHWCNANARSAHFFESLRCGCGRSCVNDTVPKYVHLRGNLSNKAEGRLYAKMSRVNLSGQKRSTTNAADDHDEEEDDDDDCKTRKTRHENI